ncbi:M-phase inducer phosphatase-like isoform X2 [Rhodnius prolixus]|uniref:M-phase inducer phosphatase-like isoform X2 n=1 Tax=Rhodnius prolixus TaxID=13249 RepID=UPI003D18B064
MIYIDDISCDLLGAKLLSAGLRVSTPPGRLAPRRLQLVPDENNPLSSPPPLCTRMSRARTPLEDHDPNSQDSGCALSDADSISSFRFAEPCGFPPKRLNSMESPRRSLQFSSFSSDNSCSSTDDGFLDMLSSPLKTEEENARLPSGLGSLISGQILSENRNSINSPKRPATFARRSISENSTPLRRRGITSLRQEFALKRPLGDLLQTDNKSPGKENSKTSICSTNNLERIKRVKSMKDDVRAKKSAKGTLFHYGFWKETCAESNEEILAKPVSDKEISIKLALQRSTQEDLIGDFSRPFALPLMTGVHQDLKTISSETLAKLINGEFKESIESFKIIDCRYPYEFEGGHIKGAVNIYTCDDIIRELLEAQANKQAGDSKDKRENVLIFHCEFSSERGPFLSRFLRREDRAGNEYPCLHYPEVYLLHGGYSEFFKTHGNLCEPRSYRAMQDPAHTTELKHFRAKSKSWAPGYHKKQTIRSLTRLQY